MRNYDMTGQTILEVGSEGGSLILFGEKRAEGWWRFWTFTNEISAFDSLSEADQLGVGSPVRTSQYVHSLPEGLKLLDQYPWFRLYPLKVHPEFHAAILLEVRKRGTAIDEARWRENLE
jgi:hypothetical protein